MLYPDCRTDESYNQDFLHEADKNFLDGFDWAVEKAVDNFFNNNMFELVTSDTYIGHILCEELPKNMQEEYEVEFTFPCDKERETESRQVKTYADLIRYKLLTWIEMERNDLITSMIEGMDTEIYETIRHKVLKDNEKSESPKEYYNSRKYMTTGIKEFEGKELK